MQRLDGRLELVPVVWIDTGLTHPGHEHPPIEAGESVWRAAHLAHLTRRGYADVPLLWGRPPWLRVSDLPTVPELEEMDRGLALLEDGQPVVLPGCCCDVDPSEWADALAEADAGWRMVWVGHPWIYVKRDGQDMLLSDYTEGAEPRGPKWCVSADRLDRAVEAALRTHGSASE